MAGSLSANPVNLWKSVDGCIDHRQQRNGAGAPSLHCFAFATIRCVSSMADRPPEPTRPPRRTASDGLRSIGRREQARHCVDPDPAERLDLPPG